MIDNVKPASLFQCRQSDGVHNANLALLGQEDGPGFCPSVISASLSLPVKNLLLHVSTYSFLEVHLPQKNRESTVKWLNWMNPSFFLMQYLARHTAILVQLQSNAMLHVFGNHVSSFNLFICCGSTHPWVRGIT